MYSEELSDPDDTSQVWGGLAVAMYMSDELTDAVIKNASKMITTRLSKTLCPAFFLIKVASF